MKLKTARKVSICMRHLLKETSAVKIEVSVRRTNLSDDGYEVVMTIITGSRIIDRHLQNIADGIASISKEMCYYTTYQTNPNDTSDMLRCVVLF